MREVAASCLPGAGQVALDSRAVVTLRRVRKWLFRQLQGRQQISTAVLLADAGQDLAICPGQEPILRDQLLRAIRALCYEGLAITILVNDQLHVRSCPVGARELV
ncbi:unnamed protein product [Polarella glacialis]|uniref:Uncharacterized protein n=1 Tax=Polarella glacialis TaxID=89957 RepID=A0A813K899_POLGL|nr:unnamed protein product [Polarella glacialis]